MNNKREYYRLELYGLEDILIIYPDGKVKGKIKDISVTGVGFETEYEIYFDTALLQFELDNIKFERKAEFLRKKNLETGRTFYAVKFFDYTEKERQILFQTLMKIDARKRYGKVN
jgi:hypothetical protein